VEMHDIFGLVPTCEFMYNFVSWEIIISLCYPIANVNGKRHGTVPLDPSWSAFMISVTEI
jgi:hypothetical protein